MSLLLQNALANASGVNPRPILFVSLLLLVIALASMRLSYVLSHWKIYRASPAHIWHPADGGMSLYGGIAAVLSSPPILQIWNFSFGQFWDLTVPSIFLGITFARLGCLHRGCCAGRPGSGPFVFDLPDQNGNRRKRYPVQLLEAALALAITLVTISMQGRSASPGHLFGLSIAFYCAIRLLLDTLRDRNPYDLF
jgi:phosphatidylglycerol:prolipoprotein diacylglycerol transferase